MEIRNMNFNLGDTVWVYNCPCMPKKAMITGKIKDVDVYIYRIFGDILEKQSPAFNLYACHGQLDDLKLQMAEDIDALTYNLKELERREVCNEI
jgi:hypothetical protein